MATIAKTMITYRREALRRALVTIPTFESRTRTIGNSMTSPKPTNMVATNPKYPSAVQAFCSSPVPKLERKPMANGRTT